MQRLSKEPQPHIKRKDLPMLSPSGFDASHALGHTSNLGSVFNSTNGVNCLDKFHTFSHDLFDKCPANDIYSLLSILNIPLLT